jgi:methyl-accepting chemotaxis protein/methyl-accepting chemotaxis protein-1 (serine sensor receptor)
MIRTKTIKTKLMASCGGLLALAAVLGVSSLQVVSSVRRELDAAVNVIARKQMLAGQISTAAADMTACERGVAFSTVLQQPDKAADFKRRYAAVQEKVEEHIASFTALMSAGDSRQELEAIRSEHEFLKRGHAEMIAMLEREQMDAALKHFDETLLPHLNTLSTHAKQLVDGQGKQLAAVAARAERVKAQSQWTILLLIGVSIGVGCGVMLVVRQSTSRLRDITAQISSSSDEVSLAAGQISSASKSLADGAAEQAGSIERTSVSSQQISAMTQKNADNTHEVARLMEQVDQRVSEANRTLEHMVVSMQEINSSSEKIARIIKVIDEIAFQTNILALNAAVEAARAGEAGMGFSVVADEVRSLAQRCAQAAKDTESLIEESISKAGNGVNQSNRMSGAIRSINESTAQVKKLVEEVSAGGKEQARGVDQIARTITSMERATHQAAASAEECAAASENMSSQADRMGGVVAELVALVGSSAGEHR